MIKRIPAIIRLRCAHCLVGPVFNGLVSMNRTCPYCGIVFEREHGYFSMAVFIAYVIYALLLGPLYYVLVRLGQFTLPWLIVSLVGALVASPFIFRYARVIWLHVDEVLDPRSHAPAGAADLPDQPQNSAN